MLLGEYWMGAGVNAESESICASERGTIIYASGNNVMMIRNEKCSLVGSHTDRIHCVRILECPLDHHDSREFAVSCASDGQVCVWDLISSDPVKCIQLESSINALEVFFCKSTFTTSIYFVDTNACLYKCEFDNKDYTLTDYSAILSLSSHHKKIISLAIFSIENVECCLLGLSDNLLSFVVDGEIKLSVEGHSNWINSIQCNLFGDVMRIASASSDKTVRIWSVHPFEPKEGELQELVTRKREISFNNAKYTVDCETILWGHEGMVNSVRWCPDGSLVSCASDGSIFVWTLTAGDSQWRCLHQIGQFRNVGADRPQGIFAVHYRAPNLLAVGSTGSILCFDGEFNETAPLITGHLGGTGIESSCWSKDGRYFLTVGLDKSTRVWIPLHSQKYGEISRAQIHGYEMRDINSIGNLSFLSAGDEKILRSFVAPPLFTQRLLFASGETSSIETCRVSAVLPALNLSNKTNENEELYAAKDAVKISHNLLPTEHELSLLTLWPETGKLYGHGQELFCFGVDSDGQIAASASKASNPIDAQIRFWTNKSQTSNQDEWSPLPHTINAHSLTVCKIRFSPDSTRLLSVGRDRHWSIVDVSDMSGRGPKLLQYERGHSRVIWSCCWGSSSDTFFTGSRDGFIRRWCLDESSSKYVLSAELSMDVSVESLDFKDGLIASGLENGKVCIFESGSLAVVKSYQLSKKAIKSISWSPNNSSNILCVSDVITVIKVD